MNKMILGTILDYIKSFNKDYIKTTIGDSTNNNRSITTSQAVRFLTRKNSSPRQRLYGKVLRLAYNIERNGELYGDRHTFNNRIDSIELREFVDVVYLRRVSNG